MLDVKEAVLESGRLNGNIHDLVGEHTKTVTKVTLDGNVSSTVVNFSITQKDISEFLAKKDVSGSIIHA